MICEVSGKKTFFNNPTCFSSNFLLISALFTVAIPGVHSYYSQTTERFIEKKGYFFLSRVVTIGSVLWLGG